MTLKTISATEAKNRFGRLLRDVTLSDEAVVVERDGKPVAVVLSIAAYERLLPKEKTQLLKESPARYAFGLWANRDDIDEAWLDEGRSRWESEWPDA